MQLDPQTLLSAYAQGVFPMADRDGQVRFYTADPRGILPLDDRFHVSQTLAQLLRKDPPAFQIRINSDFDAVIRGCMSNRADGTWINEKIIRAYTELHEMGFAHSVEAWKDGELVGGLYGVSLGAAFFGESMFHRAQRQQSRPGSPRQSTAHRGYELLDSQATTSHFEPWRIEIPAGDYLVRLQSALKRECVFD